MMNHVSSRLRASCHRALCVGAGLLLALLTPLCATAAEQFLDPEIAFKLSAKALDDKRIELRFDVAPGYHLYRDKLTVQAQPAGVDLGELQVPRGTVEFDPTFQKDVEIFKEPVALILPLARLPDAAFKLVVGNQGCADKGLCYPPMERAVKVEPGSGGLKLTLLSEAEAAAWDTAGAIKTAALAPAAAATQAATSANAAPAEEAGGFAGALQSRSLLKVAGVFLLAGLLLAGLSLSMFGAYELQMPAAVQERMTQWSGRLQGGEHVGVFMMGGMSALIVGPCVAAPLAGALVYISQTKDVVLGGAALFSLASGMSVPLLLVGLSAGSLLPRAGGWMERVKHFFGVMLLGVALWMVSPVLPAWALMVGVAGLLLGSAVYLGAFERLADGVTPARALTKGVGLMFAVVATLQLAGVASGGRDLLQPLQHLSLAHGSAVVASTASQIELKFKTVGNLAQLDAAVRASTRPVMVDFYADWCVACKEFETLTFSNEAVRQRMAGLTLLRVDVTANSADDKALMRKYSLFGPPALLFFPPAGEELAKARVIGFQNAETFREHLDRLDTLGAVKLSMN